MVFMSLSSHTLAQLVVFGRDIFAFQSAEKGFVRWQLADVQFVQRGHLLAREEPFLFCTRVGFHVLTITKARGKIISDDQELNLNLYEQHFSYVSNMCSKCDRLWKHVGMLYRHERTCTGDVIYKYPGGVYHTT
jgi:hypothetical protein